MGLAGEDTEMDWTMIGGFVALAALMVGLFRDVKGDVRDLRNDNRQLRRDVDDLRTDARQWVEDLRTETRQGMEDLHTETRQGIDDLRTETREAHAQTGKRIDDMHATLLAIVPRAAADPADRAGKARVDSR